jgi:hypothetical protein
MRKDTLSEESHASTGLRTAPDKHGRFLADTPSASTPESNRSLTGLIGRRLPVSADLSALGLWTASRANGAIRFLSTLYSPELWTPGHWYGNRILNGINGFGAR